MYDGALRGPRNRCRRDIDRHLAARPPCATLASDPTVGTAHSCPALLLIVCRLIVYNSQTMWCAERSRSTTTPRRPDSEIAAGQGLVAGAPRRVSRHSSYISGRDRNGAPEPVRSKLGAHRGCSRRARRGAPLDRGMRRPVAVDRPPNSELRSRCRNQAVFSWASTREL